MSATRLGALQEKSWWPDEFNSRQRLFIGCAILSIVLIGATLGAYFLDHSNTVKAFFDGQIEVSDALLKIALPIVGIGFVVGLVLFIDRKHRKREAIYETQKNVQPKDIAYISQRRLMEKPTILSTLKTIIPNKEQKNLLRNIILTLTMLGLIMAVILMSDPSSNYWFHHNFIPTIQQGMHSKIELWKALVDIGGGTFMTVAIINIAIQIFQRYHYIEKSKDNACLFPQEIDSLSSVSSLSTGSDSDS